MQNAIIGTITFTVLAIFFVTFSLGIILYGRKQKSIKLNAVSDDDWLFSDLFKAIFDLFYKKSTSDKLAGISRKEYTRYVKIMHKKDQYEDIVGKRAAGLCVLMLSIFLAYLTSSSTGSAIAFMMIGVLAFYFLYMMPYSNLKQQAENRLFHIVDDMPRFLSLMEKAMDLPVDQAMVTTAKKFKSPLSDDILDSINKVSLGADGWEKTLTDLAKLYDLQDFSDLILEIVSSYDQGLNIRPVINRKAYEVEQKRLYTVEEHDSKIKTLIFLPVMLTKVVPLMIVVVMPMFTKL